MKEELISSEIAKLAIEKGFKYPNLGTVNMMGDQVLCSQSILQKWLREVYNIHISIQLADKNNYYFSLRSTNNAELLNEYSKEYFSFEEALEEGLLEGLKLIEKKSDVE